MSQDDPRDPFSRRDPRQAPTWPTEQDGIPSTGRPYPGQPSPGQQGQQYPGPQYPGPQGQGAPYGWQAGGAPARRNGLGTAALILGVLAVLTSWTVLFGLALGVTAVILGAVGRRRSRRGEADNGGVALAGLITGLVGALLSTALLAFGIAFYLGHTDSFSRYADCMQQATTSSQQNACNNTLVDELTGR